MNDWHEVISWEEVLIPKGSWVPSVRQRTPKGEASQYSVAWAFPELLGFITYCVLPTSGSGSVWKGLALGSEICAKGVPSLSSRMIHGKSMKDDLLHECRRPWSPVCQKKLASINWVRNHCKATPLLNLSYLFLGENKLHCGWNKTFNTREKLCKWSVFHRPGSKLFKGNFVVIGPMISETRFLSGGYSTFITTSNRWNIWADDDSVFQICGVCEANFCSWHRFSHDIVVSGERMDNFFLLSPLLSSLPLSQGI